MTGGVVGVLALDSLDLHPMGFTGCSYSKVRSTLMKALQLQPAGASPLQQIWRWTLVAQVDARSTQHEKCIHHLRLSECI